MASPHFDFGLEIPGATIVRRYDPPEVTDLDRRELPGLAASEPALGAAISHASDLGGASPESVRLTQSIHEAFGQLDRNDTLDVAPAATLIGEIHCQSIRIRGELTGAVSALGVVRVEPDAVVRGPIRGAQCVLVEGTVAGPVHGLAIRSEGLVLLAANARVIGHIQCRSVAIFEGASLVGTIQSVPA
jgi:cytoskeletal protein CcmA (bactofilin family)